MKKEWPYEDIVNLPHHVSRVHTPMPVIKRAAQFAPFAALNGYEDAIEETARLTDEMIILSESAAEELNRKLSEALMSGQKVTLTWFVPDEKKAGGAYEETTGRIRRIEAGVILMQEGLRIQTDRVVEVRIIG